jgi:predicted SAM-dependent methyltransferase
MRRLNFGCGSIQPAGWHNLDRDDFGQEHVGSTELFEDDTFDVIVAHCSLQLTEYDDVPKLLAELRRVLKTGGVLRVSLPDIARGFTAYATNNLSWFPNGEDSIDDRFSNWLTWYSTTRSLWTPDAIINRLRDAGFNGYIDEFEFGVGATGATELDDREHECFFIEATK